MTSEEFLNQLLILLKTGGPAAAVAGGVIVLLVRALRASFFQGWLPAPLKWEKLPGLVKFLLPFGLAFLGTILPALWQHQPIIPLLPAALMAGLAAVLEHHVTKTAGKALDRRATLPAPTKIRRAISPVLPIDEKAFLKKLRVVR